ncbi:hypothetical protein WICPIJ_006856, partial [Wickerhamomyces pijperi]
KPRPSTLKVFSPLAYQYWNALEDMWGAILVTSSSLKPSILPSPNIFQISSLFRDLKAASFSSIRWPWQGLRSTP